MVICELCGHQFKTTQGLRGHKTFVHGIFASSNTPVSETDDSHLLSKLETRIEQLEKRTGISDAGLPGATEDGLSLNKKLTDITKQVDSHTKQLNDISQATASNTDLARIVDKVDDLNSQLSNFSRSVQSVRQLPGNVICLEKELSKRASNTRVSMLEDKVARLEKENVKTEEQLKSLVEAFGCTIDKFIETTQQIRTQMNEQKLVTDWVRKEHNLKLVTKTR